MPTEIYFSFYTDGTKYHVRVVASSLSVFPGNLKQVTASAYDRLHAVSKLYDKCKNLLPENQNFRLVEI